jgi:hypothetical protein
MTIILLALVAYLLYSSGALSKLGISSVASIIPGSIASGPVQSLSGCPGPETTPNPPTQAVIATYSAAATAAAVNAVGAGINVAASASPLSGVAATAATSAFSALSSIFLNASAARGKAATSENQAVAAAIPGWDAAVQQISSAYNSGCITASQAQTLFSQILANYWAEVTPQIQSGRNGCAGGASCGVNQTVAASATSTGTPYGVATTGGVLTAGGVNCSGNNGAACCVGCDDLGISNANLQWAVANAAKTGKPTLAFVQVIEGSKYGGVTRPYYTVTFTPPVNAA